MLVCDIFNDHVTTERVIFTEEDMYGRSTDGKEEFKFPAGSRPFVSWRLSGSSLTLSSASKALSTTQFPLCSEAIDWLPGAQCWSMRHCECVEVSRQSWSQATSCSSPPWTRSPPSCPCSSDPLELVDLDQQVVHLEVNERRGLQGPGEVARTPRRTSVPSCRGCSPSPHTAWKEK